MIQLAINRPNVRLVALTTRTFAWLRFAHRHKARLFLAAMTAHILDSFNRQCYPSNK